MRSLTLTIITEANERILVHADYNDPSCGTPEENTLINDIAAGIHNFLDTRPNLRGKGSGDTDSEARLRLRISTDIADAGT